MSLSQVHGVPPVVTGGLQEVPAPVSSHTVNFVNKNGTENAEKAFDCSKGQKSREHKLIYDLKRSKNDA